MLVSLELKDMKGQFLWIIWKQTLDCDLFWFLKFVNANKLQIVTF